jgi:hypothetical protein
MNTAYKILFAIDLQHEYYANGKCTDIGIVPSADTMLLLKNGQMLYKMVGNKFVVLVKVQDSGAGVNAGKPFIPLSADARFTFYLRLNKPVFTAVTNIDFDAFRTKRYYFSNHFENINGTVSHLTSAINNYDGTADYKPGDMVADVAKNTFECVKEKAGGMDDNDTEAWRKLGKWELTDVLTFDTPVPAYSNAQAYKKFDIVKTAANKAFECSNDTVAGTNTSNAAFWNPLGDLTGNELTPLAAYPKFTDVNSYAVFDKIRNDADEVFEYYVKTISGAHTENEKYWFNRGINAYATANDMYSFISRVPTFTAKIAATSFLIKVFAFNAATRLFDTEVVLADNNIKAGNIPVKQVQVNLQNLADGRYIIKINGDDYENGTDANGNPIPFFLSDEVVYKNHLGVIEIYNSLNPASSFALLAADGKVKDEIVAGKPVWLNYVIKFANKLATWKYIVRAGGVKSVKDAVPGIVFNKTTIDQQDIFESNRPIILSEKPSAFDLLLTNAVSSQPPPAPNPDPQINGIISRTNTDYYCTIYLNY